MPPFSVSVSEVPNKITVDGEAEMESAGLIVIYETVVLTQVVVLHLPTALT